MSKGHIVAGLDIGSSMTKALVAARKSGQEEFEVLSQVSEPSFGVRKGVVFNTDNVSEISQLVLRRAEEESGQRIDSVYVNVGGAHIFSTLLHGLVSVSRADRKIPKEDVDRVLQAAQTVSVLQSNKEIIEMLPTQFIVDGAGGLKDVVGMEGIRLEVDVLGIGAFSPYLKNLTSAVLNSGVQIDDVVPSAIAAGRAVLKEREKEMGVALVEIGAGTTNIAVYKQGDLVHIAVLPIGSGHVTNDIAAGLKVDVDMAEKIKLEFGSCFHRGPDKKEKIELDEDETITMSHRQVAEITGSRIAEIFEEVSKELKKLPREIDLPSGIVLTGGGAKMPKILELAKRELKTYCRIGKPHGFLPGQDDTSLATVCGLVLLGFDQGDGGSDGGFEIPLVGGGFGFWLKRLLRAFTP